MAGALFSSYSEFTVTWGNTWTVVLRCYDCRERFAVEDVAFDAVNGLSLVVPCPSCGARPFIARRGGAEPSRLHKFVDLADAGERSAGGVRVLLRLKPEWHERLAARARRGSEAEWRLKISALRRPSGEYILECDDAALTALAALADASNCPDAIQAMRDAYLAAIAE